MKLYDCRIAPNPRRLNIFLAEKGITLDTVQVDILAGENLGAAFQAVNPRGLLPTLVLDDGTVIDEVMAICRYFEIEQPDPALLGRNAREAALVVARQRHMEFDGMIAVSEMLRNSAPAFATRSLPGVAGGSEAVPGLVARGTATFQRCLTRIEDYASKHRFIAGDAFSMADITALCAIDFAGWVKVRVPEAHVHTRRWYDEVSQRPSTKA